MGSNPTLSALHLVKTEPPPKQMEQWNTTEQACSTVPKVSVELNEPVKPEPFESVPVTAADVAAVAAPAPPETFDELAKPALAELAKIAKRVDAVLTPVQTIPATDAQIEAAMESLPDADSVTRSLIAAESEPAPVVSDADFQDALLAKLPQKFSWYELLAAAAKFGLDKQAADQLGMKIWRERGLLLRLHDTADFIKSHDRPKGSDGLVALEGVLPCAQPEPF